MHIKGVHIEGFKWSVAHPLTLPPRSCRHCASLSTHSVASLTCRLPPLPCRSYKDKMMPEAFSPYHNVIGAPPRPQPLPIRRG